MATPSKEADRLLREDHYYLWGDKIVLAYKDGGDWVLMLIDRQTTRPVEAAFKPIKWQLVAD